MRPMSFELFAEKVRLARAIAQGRRPGWEEEITRELVRVNPDGLEEEIHVRELDSPRPGTYRAVIASPEGNDPATWPTTTLTARYKTAEDTSSDTDFHGKLQKVWSNTLENLEGRAMRADTRVDKLEEKLDAKEQVIAALRGEIQELQAEILDLEGQLEDEQILDEPTAMILIELAEMYFGKERIVTAIDVLFRTVEQRDPKTAERLLKKCPDAIAALVQATGRGDDGAGSEADPPKH